MRANVEETQQEKLELERVLSLERRKHSKEIRALKTNMESSVNMKMSLDQVRENQSKLDEITKIRTNLLEEAKHYQAKLEQSLSNANNEHAAQMAELKASVEEELLLWEEEARSMSGMMQRSLSLLTEPIDRFSAGRRSYTQQRGRGEDLYSLKSAGSAGDYLATRRLSLGEDDRWDDRFDDRFDDRWDDDYDYVDYPERNRALRDQSSRLTRASPSRISNFRPTIHEPRNQSFMKDQTDMLNGERDRVDWYGPPAQYLPRPREIIDVEPIAKNNWWN